MNKPSLIVFDVNETLLDLSQVKESVNKILDNDTGFSLWFSMLLHHSLVDTVTNNYHSFSEIAKAVLPMAALKLNKTINECDVEEVMQTFKNLPPHADVEEGLDMLKSEGYKLITLTNSPPEAQQEVLKANGLNKYFDAMESVDAFKKYKPHTSVYNQLLKQFSVEASQSMMVAAHGWDIAGSASAGMHTGFVKREGQALYPLAAPATIEAKNLTELADLIISNNQ